MAAKTTRKRSGRSTGARRGRPPGSGISDLSRILFSPHVGGVLLVLVAVFTLLSLLTSARGNLVGAWITWLRGLFGMGVWLVPVVTGMLGVWLVVRAIEQMSNLPWQKPIGLILLFLVFLTGATLLLPMEVRSALAGKGDAGGRTGLVLANGLQSTLSIWGAWAAITAVGITGFVLLTDRWLVNSWAAFNEWLILREEERKALGAVRPAVPLASGIIPFWKKLFPPKDELFIPTQPEHHDPANLVRPEAPTGALLTRTPAPSAPAAPATALRALTPANPDAELINPRVVGGMPEWRLPAISSILQDWERTTDDDNHIRQQGRLIQETLALFGVPADFEGAYKGPSVTQYLIKPGYLERKVNNEPQKVKIKVAKIASLSNDLALALAAPNVRIEAPIPGTSYVGVEVPNQTSNVVGLKELMESDAFSEMKGKLRIALGEDVKGQAVCADMTRMPHLLIAGATGSGKSVCINSIISGLLLTHTPDSLRMLMVDPKMVELSVYNGVPHLLSPVVTEVDKAAQVLYWAVKEMERRYLLCSKENARDLVRYNAILQKKGEKALPYIVVVVDEMADLMMAAPEEVEKHICRLAQMARAVGIHLIIATQRPSVDVITGLIKANFPARIAFAVTSQVDSRVILDVPGAERLLGKGDMLFMAPDASKLERVQGTYLSDEEISKLVRYWKGFRTLDGGVADGVTGATISSQAPSAPLAPEMGNAMPPLPTTGPSILGSSMGDLSQPPLFEQVEAMKQVDGRDELFEEAVKIVRELGKGSISLLQRRLRIGYSRAARLVDQLEEAGVLGPDLGASRGREYVPGSSGHAPPRSPATPAVPAPPRQAERPYSPPAPPATDPFDDDLPPPPATGGKPRIIGGESDDGSTTRIWF